MKKIFFCFCILLFLPTLSWAISNQTSGALGSAIITQARTLLNEDDEGLWTDTQLLVYLNDGIVDIVTKSHCLEATTTISLVANTVEYSLAAVNWIAVKAVIYNDATATPVKKGLLAGNVASVGNVEDVLEPVYYYTWGANIGVYPALTTVTVETITVYYVSRPADIAASGAVPTPAVFDKALVLYIAGQALRRDRQFGAAAQMLSDYQAEIDRYRQDMTDTAKGVTK